MRDRVIRKSTLQSKDIGSETTWNASQDIRKMLTGIRDALDQQDKLLHELEDRLDKHEELVHGNGPTRYTGPEELTSEVLWEMLQQACPGEQLDLSNYRPKYVDDLMGHLDDLGTEPPEKRGDEFDLGPHVKVRVNMWFGPFGEVRVYFDKVAIDNYPLAVNYTNLVNVGVPAAVAGIIVGAISILAKTASEKGLIIWVQVPSLVFFPLPA
jgi:hypothetical protein